MVVGVRINLKSDGTTYQVCVSVCLPDEKTSSSQALTVKLSRRSLALKMDSRFTSRDYQVGYIITELFYCLSTYGSNKSRKVL